MVIVDRVMRRMPQIFQLEKMRSLFIVALASFFLTTNVLAADDYDKTVWGIGTAQPNGAYFYTGGAWTQPCYNNLMNIDVSTAAGKAAYAAVVAAKLGGLTIHWVHYSMDASNICTASYIEIR